MNYFEFYGMKPTIQLDDQELKKKFILLSRNFHPDKFANEGETERQVALEKAVINTNAYSTLKDFDSRLKYILEIFDAKNESEKQVTDQNFLMEMMDFHDLIEELKNSPYKEEIINAQLHLDAKENQLKAEAQFSFKEFDLGNQSNSVISQLKEYYQKHNYIMRLRDTLNKIELKPE